MNIVIFEKKTSVIFPKRSATLKDLWHNSHPHPFLEFYILKE